MHGGLPLAAIAFALRRNGELAEDNPMAGVGASIWTAVIVATGAVAGVTLLVTAGHSWLPSLIEGGRLTNASRVAVGALLLLPLGALLLLLRKTSVLDLWLKLVMFAWLCTITLGALLSDGRFNVGWYMGTLFDALTSLFVLLILLHETIALYALQIRAAASERRERERRFNEMEAVLIHLSRVSELGQNVSAIVNEVNQPLAAINYAGAGMLLAESAPEQLKPVLEGLNEEVVRATEIVRHLRDLIADKKSERQVEDITPILRPRSQVGARRKRPKPPTIEIHCSPAASSAFILSRVSPSGPACAPCVNRSSRYWRTGRMRFRHERPRGRGHETCVMIHYAG
jgi:signal transduction histidine kinase